MSKSFTLSKGLATARSSGIAQSQIVRPTESIWFAITQQDQYTHQQTSGQQDNQDDTNEYHLHEATTDRYDGLARNVHGKPPTKAHNSQTKHDSADSLNHSLEYIA